MLARARAAALIALVPGLLRASEQVAHPSGLGASHRTAARLCELRERRRRAPRRRPRPLRHQGLLYRAREPLLVTAAQAAR